MICYVLQSCSKQDKTRNFMVVGVFKSVEHAKEYISEEDTHDHFIDEYQTGTPTVKNRKFQSW